MSRGDTLGMGYDKNQADLYLYNLRTAYRAALRLSASLRRLKHEMPLKTNELDSLDESAKEKLDAFRVRFGDLQDLLGTKVFRSLLVLEQEKIGSQLDILNQADKRGLISSSDDWIELRNLRNAFAHDYPEHETERAEALNQAYARAKELLAVLDKTLAYSKQIHAFDLKEFKPLAR